MDLGARLDSINKALEQGIDVPLLIPGRNEPTGITVRVSSYESDRARAWQRKRSNDRMKNPAYKMTAEELEAQAREFTAAMVIGWTWGNAKNADGEDEPVTIDGRVWEFTPENVREFLRRFPQLGNQIDIAGSDVSRFTQA